MIRNCVAIPAELSLQQLVPGYRLGSGRRSFVVRRGDEVSGLVNLRRVQAVPRETWATTTAADAMIPLAQLKCVKPDTDLLTALDEMDRDQVSQLPVMSDQRIQGTLTREGIASL